MTMPEAAMHETDGAEPSEDQIWGTRKLPVMETVSEAARMQCASKDQFGLRIPAADSRHHSRPYSPIYYVRHGMTCDKREKWHCRFISGNLVKASKEITIFVPYAIPYEFSRLKIHGTVLGDISMRSPHRCLRLSRCFVGDSRAFAGPLGRQGAACPSAKDQP